MRTFTEQMLVLDTDSAVVTRPLDTKNYKCAKITLIADASYDGDVTFVGSDSDLPLDFSNSADATNPYAPIEVIDYDTGNAIPGSTGITYASSASVRTFEVSSNGNKILGIITSGATGGNLKAYLTLFDGTE